MTEREQVIAELLYLKHDCLEGSATDQTLDKAIALLKAQEAVSVQKKQMEMVGLQTWDWACGNCGQTVLFSANFCPWCGRTVKWE